MQQLKPTATLQSGKYKIIRTLGQGGFGITYLAKNTMLNGQVAIKEFFMKGCCERDEHTTQITVPTHENQTIVDRFKQKFVKEAQSLFRLSHPNIVRIHDIFEENGTAYYVMEYAEGGSLAALVKAQGALPQPVATRYILQIADALTYIHQRKINHLDVKPANIMLNHQDESILIDFGLAKQYDASTGEQTSSTPVGISEGYAPMEQYKQGGVGVFSPETDVYSLGATYYKLLTGLTPPSAFDIDDQGIPVSELRAKGVSNQVIDLISQAMEPRKRDRLHSVHAFIDGLKNIPLASDPTTSDDEETLPYGNDIDDEETDIKVEQKNMPKPQPKPKPKPTSQPKPEPQPTPNKIGGKKAILYGITMLVSIFTIITPFILIFIFLYPIDAPAPRKEEPEEIVPRYVGQTLDKHEGIDLGIIDSNGNTIYWASCNIGAEMPWDDGLYFAWGDTQGYIADSLDSHLFLISTYKWAKKNDYDYHWYMTKYREKQQLDTNDDAAAVHYRGNWRMPTIEELKLLLSECYWKEVDSYQGHAVKGFVVYKAKSETDKGKTSLDAYHAEHQTSTYSDSDPHIFLPIPADRDQKGIVAKGVRKCYWSKSLSNLNNGQAYCLDITKGLPKWISSSRQDGNAIRPVFSEP